MRRKVTLFTFAVAFICYLVLVSISAAADPTPPATTATTDENWFAKLGVGGAVGWTHNLGRTIVKSASIQNGLVRIDSQQNDQVRPWIEVHAWFVEWGRAEKTDQNPKPRPQWGFGPFVAVAPGANFVDAVAMGAMIGRKYRTDSDSNLSFNLAFGAALNLNQQVLGEDLMRINLHRLVKRQSGTKTLAPDPSL